MENQPEHLEEAVQATTLIPFESLIGEPLAACVLAQKHAAEVMWQYIRDVAFRTDVKEPDQLSPKSVTFQFFMDGSLKKMTIPLLALIPVPYLQIKDVALAFKSDVVATSEGKLVGKISNTTAANSSSKFNFQSNIKVNVKASSGNMPAGLSKVLEICGNSCFDLQPVVPKQKPEEPKPEEPTPDPVIVPSSGGEAVSIKTLTDEIDFFSSNPAKPNKQNVRGIHVNWSKPYQARNPQKPYEIEDFELLSTILSALLWKKYNGTIKLYTDSTANAYYKGLGMLSLWDGDVNTKVLDGIPSSIDPKIYWAAGKLFAAQEEKKNVPIALIDTDLLLWDSLASRETRRNLVALHRESLEDNPCYLPFEELKKRKGYQPDKDWDWKEAPFNTAFSYYYNSKDAKGFLEKYTQAAIDFMKDNNESPSDMLSQMVFSEQRIYAMCAKKLGLNVYTLMSDSSQQKAAKITHIWNNKQVARDNNDARMQLCKSLLQAIRKLFPEYKFSDALKELLSKYN